MMKKSRRCSENATKIDKAKVYVIDDAVALIKEAATAKFDESIEAHIYLSVDPKKGDQQIRSTVVLPHGTGKSLRIAAITSTQQKEAKEAGAEIVGDEDLINKIKDGKLLTDIDIIVATPEMMPKLATVARVLGPRGMMPNPKAETVTTNISEAINNLKKGKIDFRNDKTANIHQVIGKASFSDANLKENYEVFISAINDARPMKYKGALIKSIVLCSTMGPGVTLLKK